MRGDATIAPLVMTSRSGEISSHEGPSGRLRRQPHRGLAYGSGDAHRIAGLLAGTLTTIAFIPQLQQTWRTRSANDVSLGMLLTFITGVFLWLNYSLMLDALPIILANLITWC